MEVTENGDFCNRHFQYVAMYIYIPSRRHKPLYTLTLTQTRKIIPNVGPEFLTLIFKVNTAQKDGCTRV